MSGAPTRVFTARLAGIAVFDPRGDQVGKVRDVVVTLRHGSNPPRVLGLVVEVQPRRRIFCPMTRVTNIDSGAVVTTGLLNMRRFEQRAGETLVLGELLDKRVTLLETNELVTVQDVAIQQVRLALDVPRPVRPAQLASGRAHQRYAPAGVDLDRAERQVPADAQPAVPATGVVAQGQVGLDARATARHRQRVRHARTALLLDLRRGDEVQTSGRVGVLQPIQRVGPQVVGGQLRLAAQRRLLGPGQHLRRGHRGPQQEGAGGQQARDHHGGGPTPRPCGRGSGTGGGTVRGRRGPRHGGASRYGDDAKWGETVEGTAAGTDGLLRRRGHLIPTSRGRGQSVTGSLSKLAVSVVYDGLVPITNTRPRAWRSAGSVAGRPGGESHVDPNTLRLH